MINMVLALLEKKESSAARWEPHAELQDGLQRVAVACVFLSLPVQAADSFVAAPSGDAQK
jgi:hypothetical protein